LDDTEASDLRGAVSSLRLMGDERASKRPGTMDAWQRWLATIYGRALGSLSTWELTALTLEQVGSTSDAIVRLYSYSKRHPPTVEEVAWRRTRLELELARFLNFLFLVAEKGAKQLSTIVDTRYGPITNGMLVCWLCGQRECACPLLIAPHDVGIDELLSLMRP
jgi:hypothetical protein